MKAPYYLFLALIVACNPGEETRNANALINETSPYLLQHAHNPVNWYPWGEEALAKAREENKLLVISIGYSACHWCHVMERESYEDTVVARMMNDHYVSIKVDREERPDIDAVYIDAAQIMNGRAGWPLNVIALPDATPVFAGTYFPKKQWISVLKRMQQIYEQNPDRLADLSAKVMENLQQVAEDSVGSFLTPVAIDSAMQRWLASIDRKNGGVQAIQKFPLPGSYLQMLNYAVAHDDTDMQQVVLLTLDRMAMGGLYDHVAGGFHRYTVEETWKIPHFEKMLYDNAQLISLYAIAFQVSGDSLYLDVVDQTINFLNDQMSDGEGRYYSSFDADSEGEEGKYYVWTKKEIDALLGSQASFFRDYFSITEEGNWEAGKNVLSGSKAQYLGASNVQRALVSENLQRLGEERKRRVAPSLDDKVLTAWNALMITGLADAYRATSNERYLEMVVATGRFIRDQMEQDGALFRVYKSGQRSVSGFLDDYAYTISAMIALYQVTFDRRWLDDARLLTDYTVQHFYSENRRLFRYTSDQDEALIVEKYPLDDNVIPSGNSVMAQNLRLLGSLYYDSLSDYRSMAEKMQTRVSNAFMSTPGYYYGWLPGFEWKELEIAVVGEEANEVRKQLQQSYVPYALYLGGASEDLPLLENKLVEGKTFIYVCKEKYCKLPVTGVHEALTQINP